MPGPLVHVGAVAACPHQAPIALTTSNVRVKVLGASALTLTDLPNLKPAGCLFQVPVPGGTKPQPCVIVELVSSARIKVNGIPVLVNAPVGAVCKSIETIPQGPPTLVTQTKVAELT